MSKITFVVDSSVIVKWLNQNLEKNIEQANKILSDVQNGQVNLITPELAKYEVGNVLLFSKKLSKAQAKLTFDEFFKLPLTFINISGILSTKAFELASDYRITFYDAVFLALADLQQTTLITENIKHQGKTKNIQVIPLADYK